MNSQWSGELDKMMKLTRLNYREWKVYVKEIVMGAGDFVN